MPIDYSWGDCSLRNLNRASWLGGQYQKSAKSGTDERRKITKAKKKAHKQKMKAKRK